MAPGKHIDVCLSAQACIFAAAALLILPLRWFAAAMIAAGFHELCHYLALRLCGVRIYRFRIDVGGAVIETELLEAKQEIVCALAGPLGSLFLVLLRRRFPILAICGCVQGLYNLLPLFPLDGGRAIRSILGLICPAKQDRLMELIRIALLSLISAIGILAFYCFRMGLGVTIMIFFPVLKVLARKIPCKDGRKGVQ